MSNPLQQYFRRPAVYLKLPSGGKNYFPDVLVMPPTGELPVYPMTAIDEITVKTPDALMNGVAVVDVIKSCIPAILDPWQLNSTDFDSVLIAIRAATAGNKTEIQTQCPKCDEVSLFNIDLGWLLSSLTEETDYDTELKIGDLLFKFKPLTFQEMNKANIAQFELQRKFAEISAAADDAVKAEKTKEALEAVTKVTMDVLSSAIDHVKTPTAFVNSREFILEFLRNCSKNEYSLIRDKTSELRAKNEIKPLDVTCPHCQNEYKQPFSLNTSDFFE